MNAQRLFRISTLVVPSLVAAGVMMRVNNDHLLHATAPALVALWVVMAGALAMRFVGARRDADAASRAEQLDVLTASGVSLMWMGATALVAGAVSGWASLSVVGVLGLGVSYLATTWTALAGGGQEPWRTATITRAILPAVAVEGDALREEVSLGNVKIPAGMRLFAIGRATRHGRVTRYAVGSEGSNAEVKLESDLGPATRGEHHAPPLALWLGDVLGLTRTPAVHRGEASFSVMPRPGTVDGIKNLLGRGADNATTVPTHRLPTEGTFRIREYQPGDDTRRIHWVRSLQTNQLVVRLPDEIPQAEPMVRLILDTHLAGTETLTCRAPDELLDVLVRVWLGIGKSLAESGTRVTLVTAARSSGTTDGAMAVIERPMLPRGGREAAKLGARAVWQAAMPLPALLARSTTRQVVVTSRAQPIETTGDVAWVVVPDVAWTSRELPLPASSSVKLPFPSGADDNSFGQRAAERRRIETMWRDRILFSQVMCWTQWRMFSGSLVARPSSSVDGRIALTVIP